MPPLPHDDRVSLTDRKLHHCSFVTLCSIFFSFFFSFQLLYIIVILNIQDHVQHSFAVDVNCGIFFGHMYIIVVVYRTLCKKKCLF